MSQLALGRGFDPRIEQLCPINSVVRVRVLWDLPKDVLFYIHHRSFNPDIHSEWEEAYFKPQTSA